MNTLKKIYLTFWTSWLNLNLWSTKQSHHCVVLSFHSLIQSFMNVLVMQHVLMTEPPNTKDKTFKILFIQPSGRLPTDPLDSYPMVTKSKHMFTVITLSLLFNLFHINTFSHLIPLLWAKDALSVFTTILKNSSINDTICSFSDLRQITHAFMITQHLKEIAVN